MRFILGLLLGYCIRGRKPLLIATLSAIAVVCFIVLPVIALSLLALDVRRERLSRPPQTTVPVVIDLNYKAAQIKLREANLNIRVLANRHGLALEPGLVIDQTPRGGERVDCGTVIGVTIIAEDTGRKHSPISSVNQLIATPFGESFLIRLANRH
jgi:beta-lactam-binding protein with PASTA domain